MNTHWFLRILPFNSMKEEPVKVGRDVDRKTNRVLMQVLVSGITCYTGTVLVPVKT